MSLIDNPSRRARTHRRGRMHLGEDILLARHGSRIQSLRLDRRADRMVATLTDGTIDCASNRLLPSGPTPVEVLRAKVDAIRTDTASVSRAELHLLLRFSAIWLAISVVLTALIVGFSSAAGSPDLLQASLTYPAY
ncbi:hypothetical protein [Sinomonas mesophila]|uniref:hypothetical protein n=1 Tax=Sinomonas mesophila TaxID=1531955 RepID=UPI00098431CE|nr:hypothetical protein [Sinomonas mesophila]